MVGRYAIPEADVTITHHLPPPEDESSTQDLSMSFTIPPQADASNLLDQNYDDFFSGPGFVTLSTPVLPRRLANTTQSVRKVAATIRTPVGLSSPNLGQTLARNSTTKVDMLNCRAELQETHISPHSLPSLSPSTTSAVDPGPPRPNHTTSKSDPDPNSYDCPTSNTTPLVSSSLTTEASGTQPGIQSMSVSDPSRHSTNPQNAQISRQFPTTAAAQKKKNKVPAQPRENASVKPTQITLKSRSARGPDCETVERTQSHIRGGAVKRPNSTLSNHSFGGVKGRIGSNPACSNSRGNVTSYAPSTGNEHSDPDSLSLDVPVEGNGAVTQSLVTTVLPPSTSTRSRFNLEPGGADMSDSPPSLDPPRTPQDRLEAKISLVTIGEEDAQLRVSQLSPSKTVRRWRDHAGRSDWNEESSAPTLGTPIAVSPMRPSIKRASSAGQESDNEPDGACPDEWEKQRLVDESNREGEVRGGGEGKQVQGTRQKALAPLQPSRKKTGEASSSLTLTRRLKAKAVRESPRVRKLRDRLARRVVAGGGAGRRPVIGGATGVSRGGQAMSDARGFPGHVGASTTPSVVMLQGKGSDLTPLDETTGLSMPYSGDNQEEEGGVINRFTGSVVGGPSFHSTLKRSTVPVEFRFELAARLGTSRGSAAKENPGPGASGNSKERGEHKATASSRKRPKLAELRGGKNGEVGFAEPASSSGSSETKDVHRDQIGSRTGAWKGNTHLRSDISSLSKRRPLIVPEGFKFSTEQRAKDREEFDRAVRVKQEEKERQLEEERAAKAIEEEREIKEMRKRAVPKASSVPGWYAGMPKRKAG